jgi:mRNA-degrading endonuclease RelE of RelBE toxin-antitoxin system
MKQLSKSLQLQLADIIDQLQDVHSLSEIPNLKKLKGYKTAYRIKLGDYRIGFLIEDNIIRLSRVMHRREIYRYFP